MLTRLQSKVVMSLLSLFVTSLYEVAAQQSEYGTTLQFFPQIAINGGATTSFLIHNATGEAISVKVELFQPDGTRLEPSTVVVEAKQSRTVDFGGPGGSLTAGWAKLSSNSRFAATELFQIRDGGKLIEEVGVLPSSTTKEFRIFGINNPNVRTGVAVANPNDTPVTVAIRRFNSGSAVNITLPAFQQQARFLDELFSEPNPFDEVVEFSATQPVAGVTLRLDGDQLAALPVITGEGLPADGSVTKFKIADATVVRSLKYDVPCTKKDDPMCSDSGTKEAVLQNDVKLSQGTGIRLTPLAAPNVGLKIESSLRVPGKGNPLQLLEVTKVDPEGNPIEGQPLVTGPAKTGDVAITIKDNSLVRSVGGLKDDVSILPGDNINVDVSTGKKAITISAPPAVRAINSVTGNLSILGGPSIDIAQEPANNAIRISSNGVRTLNGVLRGDVHVVGGANVVVTQDQANNNLIISNTGGGGTLSLPYAGSTNSQNPAFQVKNSGSGAVASFTLDDPSNTQANLLLNSAGSGDVLFARTSGLGAAASFSSTNSARTKAIVSIDGNAGAAAPTLLVSSRNPIGTPAVRIEGGPGSALFVQASGDSPDSAAKFAGSVTVTGLLTVGQAAQFNDVVDVRGPLRTGDVFIAGRLTKSSGSFRIDHPLDPANKYLSHSFVESPDMMNIYNGNVRLDQNGDAWIDLPAWFEALNRDFRYQLTALRVPCPNLYISEEVSNNRFKIAGGAAGAKVSWQVTGIRHDAHANAHRIQVEEEKPKSERGKYSTP